MRYLHVRWCHDLPDEPVELYSELDEHDWEIRKVEVFPDGRMGLACANETTGATRLGEAPVPPTDEIATDPQFLPEEITPEAFERVWHAAHVTVPPH